MVDVRRPSNVSLLLSQLSTVFVDLKAPCV